MKEYYQRHKDYWRNYYQRRKSSGEGKVSKKDRREYVARIRAAWFHPHPKTVSLTKMFRKLRGAKPQPPAEEPKTSLSRLRGTVMGILEGEGFHSIECPEYVPTSMERKPSTLQALAHKGEGKCIVEVVTSPFKVYTSKRREYLRSLLKFFNAKYFLCFLKPDLSRYHLLEMEPHRIRSVSLGLKAIAAMKPTPT
ncbi:hypothetical protein KEJ23_06880 [Candidatus Bathyarchaeota archaeon]|nr:hypothetical protein [Candidatus Bathyarchaeota archaeon]